MKIEIVHEWLIIDDGLKMKVENLISAKWFEVKEYQQWSSILYWDFDPSPLNQQWLKEYHLFKLTLTMFDWF